MDNETLMCKNCGAILLIDETHVSFKGGKTAYIKCPDCGFSKRISWTLVEHLKFNEADSEINDRDKNIEGTDDDELLKALDDTPKPDSQAVKEDEGSFGWVIGGLAALGGTVLIALRRR